MLIILSRKSFSGLLMRLTCSFLKLAFSLGIITFLLIFSEKLDISSKILIFLKMRFQNIISPPPQDILDQIVIEMSSGKLKLHNLGSFIFKIVVLNQNYSETSIKRFYVIPMWQRLFSFFPSNLNSVISFKEGGCDFHSL